MKNFDGLWKLNPSALRGYEECPSCFWAEQHIGRHPFTLPLRLNDAMDERLKLRYDGYREKDELPPEIAELSKEGIKLFKDIGLLNHWRTEVSALRYINKEDGYVLEGKLDEVLVKDNLLIPADYKSSGDAPKEDKQKYYKLQLHAYAFMIKKRGHNVSDIAYLLHYFTKNRKDPSLHMEFICHVDKVDIDLKRFEKTLKEIAEFLNGKYPGNNKVCPKCQWLDERKKI